jgi:hypothetical protein
VVGVGRWKAELAEDVADVLFDGALGDREAVGDGAVGAALGHQGEDVALARGERVEGGRVPGGLEQAGDDLGVEGGAARRDPGDRVVELRDVGDPVLEQVADPA